MSHALRPHRLFLLLASALLLATAVLPATARLTLAAGGSTFVSVANGYRTDSGLGPVSLHARIDQIAVERGVQLADNDELGHDFTYLKRRFDEEGICWTRFGEIVAYNSTGSISAFGSQWWNSSGHRSIMLGEYTHAGGSRAQADDGRWYAVMVFVKLCGVSTAPPPIAGFTDIADSSFKADISWLVEEEITYGCTETRFCPRDPVARGQMASFIRRAMPLPDPRYDYFVDDNGSTHEGAINRVAEAELTTGCTATRYCPQDSVTRAQMAAFLARALDLPPAGRDYFSDDDGVTGEDAINRMAAAGLAFGCAEDRFCPTRFVTREQMAAFLHRAFD